MREIEIRELVRLARQGSPAAYEELVRRYSRGLFGYFSRSVSNRADAEELLGELFLRLVRGLGRYCEQERFEVWLYRMARNLVIDFWRKRRPMATAEGVEKLAVLAGGERDPHEAAVAGEDVDRLQAALAKLPAQQRELLLLRYFGGLSFDEIARTVGCPIGTALARAHRGIRKLRSLLQEHDSERI